MTTETIGGTVHDYACDPATTCSNQNITAGVTHLRGLVRDRYVYSSKDANNQTTRTE